MSLLHEAGTATQTGMGLVPLSWQEIESWVKCSGLNLTPWELQVVHRLSVAYTAEYSQATDVKRIQPYIPAVEEIDRTAVSNNIKNILSMFKSKPKTLKDN